MVNILNKGRCSRCLAAKKEFNDEVGKLWHRCQKYKTWCRIVARFLCKESPMGIAPEDLDKIIKPATVNGVVEELL